MVNMWQEALKEFNTGKAFFSIPKKGTSEYKEVKKIQAKLETRQRRGVLSNYHVKQSLRQKGGADRYPDDNSSVASFDSQRTHPGAQRVIHHPPAPDTQDIFPYNEFLNRIAYLTRYVDGKIPPQNKLELSKIKDEIDDPHSYIHRTLTWEQRDSLKRYMADTMFGKHILT